MSNPSAPHIQRWLLLKVFFLLWTLEGLPYFLGGFSLYKLYVPCHHFPFRALVQVLSVQLLCYLITACLPFTTPFALSQLFLLSFLFINVVFMALFILFIPLRALVFVLNAILNKSTIHLSCDSSSTKKKKKKKKIEATTQMKSLILPAYPYILLY